MKILIISNHAYPAQGPRAFRTTELSEQLVKMGHEVILYTVHGKYDYTQYVKDTGVIRRDINPQMMRHIDTTSLTNSCTIFFTVCSCGRSVNFIML